MKEIDIFGLSIEDTYFLEDVLKSSIKEKVKINCISLEEEFISPRYTSVVLITGSFLLEKAKEVYPNSHIIISKRTLTGKNFEKIMILNKNKKVLVTNSPKEAIFQTINTLKELGLNHLKYIPYIPNMDLDYNVIDTVISPGHLHLCPKEIIHRIDLGRRTISLATFSEVINKLELSNKNLHNFENFQIRHMVEASRKITKLLMKSEKTSKNLEFVLSKVEESIILINENDEIILLNPAAEKLFDIKTNQVLNENCNKVFSKQGDLLTLLSSKERINQVIIDLNGKKIVGSLEFIKTENEETKIITIEEVKKIQELEGNVRKKLHNKGHFAKYTFESIKGKSKTVEELKQRAKNFSKSDLAVLIRGESGTGKELFAHAVHNESQRRDKPFIALNFAALPESLVESELFGYEEGAFTGAMKGGKSGLFEQAHGGTIFLDEIGDAPMSTQSRLLRVIQEKEVMRVGSSRIIPVDVRIIAATNKNLKKLVEDNKFREDLYYRLKVLPLYISPLRERKDDIPELIKYKMSELGRSFISSEVMENLIQHDWPGNARELENILDYLFVISKNKEICTDDLLSILQDCHIINKTSKLKVEFYIQELERTASLNEYIAILESLYNNSTKGRNSILRDCRDKKLNLSEAKIRTRLKRLESLSLIESGRTRQGSNVTHKGIEVLRHLKEIYT